MTTDDAVPPTDPRQPQIDIPAQRHDHPGHTEHLDPRPDREDSDVGRGRQLRPGSARGRLTP